MLSKSTSQIAAGNLVNKIVEKKLVPVGKRQIYKLLANYKLNGSPSKGLQKSWGETGRNPYLDRCDVGDIVLDLQSNSGYCLDSKSLEATIAEKQKNDLLARGIQPLSSSNTTPSATSIRNYKSLIAAQPGVSVARTAVIKSPTRYTAENSLRSAMSFILTTAATHFTLSTQINPDVYKDIKRSDAVSESSKFLFDQISKVHNNRPLQPVRRAYVMSTDDTTEFVFQGQGSNLSKAEFVLVSSKALATSGTRAKFKTGSTDCANGLRVKLTHTFAANGTMAPLFVSVCGLTERELPTEQCPSGVLVLKIAGLCIGEASATGTVIFVRNDNDKQTDKVRFRVYRDDVFLPFVSRQRTLCDGWNEGCDIDDSLRVVSWCDGDIQQIATIVEDETLQKFKSLKIVANKQSAARSATEQAADLAKVFKTQHALQYMTTAANVDPSNHPMKRVIMQGFEEMMDKGLNLNLIKRKALIDFLSCIPEVLTKAATRSNIVHGFVSNGLVGDERSYNSKFAMADFKLMLSTIRRDVTTTEYELCKSTFAELFKIQLENGFVSESEYDRLGFSQDMNVAGEEVLKTATVSQECRQRAKNLSHKIQVELRKERENLLEAEEKRKAANRINKCHKLLQDNKTCEAKLNGTAVTLELLSKCNSKELQAFIHVRNFKTERTEDWKWPRKGKLEEAESGEDNLIKRAFDCSQKEVILTVPSLTSAVPSETPNTRHTEAGVVHSLPRANTIFQ